MFTFSSARAAMWMLVVLLMVATGFVACDVAIAADLTAAPDVKNSQPEPQRARSRDAIFIPIGPQPPVPTTLKIKPDKHDFGQVIVPLTSAPQTIRVSNNSKSASIEFTSIVAAPPFSIQTDGCSGAPLAAGSSCNVEVVFHPTVTGKITKKKALTFTDSARKSPQHVELSGQGIVGATPTATVTATPTATATATITATPTISATPTLTATPSTTVRITPAPTATATVPCIIHPTGTIAPTITPSATPSPGPQAGDVLIAGGDTGGSPVDPISHTSGTHSTSGAQVFNKNTSAFDAVGSMHTDREAAAAVLLENNKVLVVGGERCFEANFGGTEGYECTALNTAELYDPVTQTFTAAGSGSCGSMIAARAGATATLINQTNGTTFLNGRILIVGGTSGSSFQSDTTPPPPGSGAPTGQVAQNTAEIYDPVSDTFSPVAATVPVPSTCGASQTSPCGLVNHAAVLIGAGSGLDQGRVLIAGGDLVSPLNQSTNLAFIFHPTTQTFTTAGSMNTARESFSLTANLTLLSGLTSSAVTALAAGGITAASNVCATAGDLLVTTNNTGEVYNPATDTWTAVSNDMNAKRAAHSAVLLLAGALEDQTLLAGGIDFEAGTFPSTCVAGTSLTQTTTASADLFNPATTATGAFAATGSLNQARGGQGFGVIGAFLNDPLFEPLVVGGECSIGTAASYIIGTSAAASSCDVNAQNDYSETFDQSTQTWSLGPNAPASGVSPSAGPVSANLH